MCAQYSAPEKNDNSNRLFVGNLGDNVTKDEIEKECSKYGSVKQIWHAIQPSNFAFVDFGCASEAEKACDMLNGAEALGSTKLEAEVVKQHSDPDLDAQFGE